jgi:hypothetical protein
MLERREIVSRAWLGLGLFLMLPSGFRMACAHGGAGATEPSGDSPATHRFHSEVGAQPAPQPLQTAPSRTASDDRKPPEDSKSSTAKSLRMSEAVVCRSIEGYEDYEPLPDAALTSDEKLLVYYRPFGYKSTFVKDSYQAHFTQDFQIRRRGGKAVLFQKLKMLDYTAKSPRPPERIYFRNTISLKGLKPGDYDLVIILHDEIDKGAAATQVVKFRVIPAADPRKKAAGSPSEDPASPRE